MTYQSVWWHDPLEHGAGLQPNRTWPTVMEQYRRPTDQRYYDLPTENYESKLYYERTHLGKPIYRGLFRDKPHTVTAYHPSGIENKPKGFHGRLYYEQENPQFKYHGRPKNDLYWLEMPPYRPEYTRQMCASTNKCRSTMPAICKSTNGPLTTTARRGYSQSAPANYDPCLSHVTGTTRITRETTRSECGPCPTWNSRSADLLQTYCKPPSAGTAQFQSNRLTQDGPGYL